MSAGPDDPASGTEIPAGLGESDRILLLALRAWAPVGALQPDPSARLLNRLESSWARRLVDAMEIHPGGSGDRGEARARLREAHRTEARVDLTRVHPSWWARGLREESPSVRRAVVAAASEPMRGRVQSELLLDNDDLRAERPADPEILAWACSLWTERLVGGEPRKADDPPVIVAMSSVSPRAAYRLCRYAGELKLTLAGQHRARWTEPFAASTGPEFAVIARHDLRSTAAAAAKLPPRRLSARFGLLTVARLLGECEPFRVRWALQQWPYTVAKLVRALIPPPTKRTPVMIQVESEILKAACGRLRGMGKPEG